MPLTSRAERFAPISSEPSLRVRLVSWYFTVVGALQLLALGIGIAIMASGRFGGLHLPILGVVVRVATALGWMWTGWLLSDRRRLGVVIAMVSFAAPLVTRLFGAPLSRSSLLFTIVGLALTASIWPEVRDASERRD